MDEPMFCIRSTTCFPSCSIGLTKDGSLSFGGTSSPAEGIADGASSSNIAPGGIGGGSDGADGGGGGGSLDVAGSTRTKLSGGSVGDGRSTGAIGGGTNSSGSTAGARP